MYKRQGLSIASAFSTLIHPSRNGILGLISAFFINVISKRKLLLSKKSFLEISISLIFIFIAILIVFPFLSRIGTDVRGNYDITFFFEALKSIFVAGSNDDSLSGSVDHRLIMLFLTLGQLFTNIQYFFLGIPLDINYTEAVFNDPHNGYVSIFARGGIFNLLSFIFLQYQLIRKILLCLSLIHI